jgi:hypothetical protein
MSQEGEVILKRKNDLQAIFKLIESLKIMKIIKIVHFSQVYIQHILSVYFLFQDL